jgi:hypothetical protein
MEVKQISYDEMNDLPKTVYKYRNWSDNFHKEIITEQIVFMARPTSFEDQSDCKLIKRYDYLLTMIFTINIFKVQNKKTLI